MSRRRRFWWEVLIGVSVICIATRPDLWIKQFLRRVKEADRESAARVAAHRREQSEWARGEAYRAAAEGLEWLKQKQREEMLFSGDYMLTAEQEVERALIEIERLRKRIEES